MIEVWNKIDLLETPINYEDAQFQDSQIVPISAVYRSNLEKLLRVIEQKGNEVKGKKEYLLVHPLQ